MILDSSAIVAVLTDEPERDLVYAALDRYERFAIGAPTLLETTMVMTPRSRSATTLIRDLVEGLEIEVIAFGEEHLTVAVAAFHRYGKGTHRARLNYGDCMAYAVAKLSRQPLICIGDDFAQTDLELVPLHGP